jgi:hypothetical protein
MPEDSGLIDSGEALTLIVDATQYEPQSGENPSDDGSSPKDVRRIAKEMMIAERFLTGLSQLTYLYDHGYSRDERFVRNDTISDNVAFALASGYSLTEFFEGISQEELNEASSYVTFGQKITPSIFSSS